MKLSVIGYPRIGSQRELKRVVEAYLDNTVTREELEVTAKTLKTSHWQIMKDKGIDYIPSNDFCLLDHVLDMAVTLNVIPNRFKVLNKDLLTTYFYMANGIDNSQDISPLVMKKWYNTNYNFLVPEIEPDTEFRFNSNNLFANYKFAQEIGIKTKPVIIGPFTFLKLCTLPKEAKLTDYIPSITQVYEAVFKELNINSVELLQVDEPEIVRDLTPEDIELFRALWEPLLQQKAKIKILLQTYFGDIRDIYQLVMNMDFDAYGLDLVDGRYNLDLIWQYGFPDNKQIFAGILNGRNIWKANYARLIEQLQRMFNYLDPERTVLSTSCSLMHLPYSTRFETAIPDSKKRYLAFAEEKLDELNELRHILAAKNYAKKPSYLENIRLFKEKQVDKNFTDPDLRQKISRLRAKDFERHPESFARSEKQEKALVLPLLPTTTMGSFPQTEDTRKLRKKLKNLEISQEQYDSVIKEKIREVIGIQEKIGLDVLVDGELDRSDMVEHFARNMDGFLLTDNGWVQSSGTLCVRPPIIFGDIKRNKPIVVPWYEYTQSLTPKIVKAVLTGPTTILNWSFSRQDLALKDIAFQIALAIKDEVTDLEAAGAQIIQIDEAGLREKLPFRKADWYFNYLHWVIKALKLTISAVKPTTQIHTHICYSRFADILREIRTIEADVFSFEALNSNMVLLDLLNDSNFTLKVGPGVYNTHLSYIPTKKEIYQELRFFTEKVDPGKVWVNPDCGLKIRTMNEVVTSLKNMVAAAKQLRTELLERSSV